MNLKTDTRTDRKYLIKYYKHPKWVFSWMDKVQGGFKSPKEASELMDEVMTFHNDFAPQNYRLIERTVVTIDETLDKFKKGW